MNEMSKKKTDSTFSGGSSAPRLPPEALKFGKQMGIDFSGLEPEAQEIWQHLERLASKDPLGYQRFVAEQMQAAKEEEESKKKPAQSGKSSATTTAEPEKKDEGGYFRPEAGFCVEVPTTGGDGLKVRVSAEALPEKTLFVNLCSSKVIEDPTDASGKKVTDPAISVADGLQIPLVVGPVRAIDGQANAVDVIFHPTILAMCEKQRFVRAQIVDLALDWVKQEAQIQFDKIKYADVVAQYTGGLGDARNVPILFHVNPGSGTSGGDGAQLPRPVQGSAVPFMPPIPETYGDSLNMPSSLSSEHKETIRKKQGKATLTTCSLLQTLHGGEEEEPMLTELNLHLPTADVKPVGEQKGAARKSKLIIEEVGGKTSSLPEEPAPVVKTADKKSGFIIEEVKSKSTGEPVAADKPKAKSVSFEDALKKGFVKADPAPKPAKSLTKEETEDLEDLLTRCDEDFADNYRMQEDEAATSGILADLAKAFAITGTGPSIPPAPTPVDNGLRKMVGDALADAPRPVPPSIAAPVRAAEPALVAPTVSVVNPFAGSLTVTVLQMVSNAATALVSLQYQLALEGLSAQAKATSLQLEVSATVIKIVVDSTAVSGQESQPSRKESVEVRFKCDGLHIDARTVSASFKKKLGKFSVDISLVK